MPSLYIVAKCSNKIKFNQEVMSELESDDGEDASGDPHQYQATQGPLAGDSPVRKTRAKTYLDTYANRKATCHVLWVCYCNVVLCVIVCEIFAVKTRITLNLSFSIAQGQM